MTDDPAREPAEMKPCPFCGGKVICRWDGLDLYSIVCFPCSAGVQHSGKSVSIAAWNRRAAPAASRAPQGAEEAVAPEWAMTDDQRRLAIRKLVRETAYASMDSESLMENTPTKDANFGSVKHIHESLGRAHTEASRLALSLGMDPVDICNGADP